MTGDACAHAAWRGLYEMTARVAAAVFPTLTGPLPSREQLRAAVGAADWEALFERPIGETLRERLGDELLAGVALTDALIGTFAAADGEDLLANRCFLYHVIGRGSGEWLVPVGGMGALTDALAQLRRAAGAELTDRCRGGRDRGGTSDGAEVLCRDDGRETALARAPRAVRRRAVRAGASDRAARTRSARRAPS